MLKTVSSLSNAIGALNYKGTWDASTNTPTLVSSVGTKGDYYVVSVAGNTDLNGTTLWGVGDMAVFNGSIWQKTDGGDTSIVTSLTVTGLTGYMYANNASPATASVTIPVASVAGAVANTVNVLAGGLLSGGGALTSNVTISLTSVPSGNVTGLGTMATQNANAVAITGGNVTADVITASTKFVGTNYDASGSGGGALRTSGGTSVLQWGGGGGVNMTLNGAFNMNPANYTVTISPTGTGTLTVNPATTGTINNVIIGGTTAAAGTFTNLTSANVSITGGTINVQSTNLVSTTSSTATFATASLPLVPAGYIQVDLNGTVVKVPYYAV
jgi:hypothetical protein